jgi:hypothetical protein
MWLDLSTGVNPWPWPTHDALPDAVWCCQPSRRAEESLLAAVWCSPARWRRLSSDIMQFDNTGPLSMLAFASLGAPRTSHEIREFTR